jgi:hypothetical protein
VGLAAGGSNVTYPVQYFKDQLLDHFNPLDNRTFTQRYWVRLQLLCPILMLLQVNQDYYDPKHPGPLVLCEHPYSSAFFFFFFDIRCLDINGEGPVSSPPHSSADGMRLANIMLLCFR